MLQYITLRIVLFDVELFLTLCIVDAGPGGEVDDIVDELVSGEVADHVGRDEGLPRPTRTD
jgi:hypothetical protein